MMLLLTEDDQMMIRVDESSCREASIASLPSGCMLGHSLARPLQVTVFNGM